MDACRRCGFVIGTAPHACPGRVTFRHLREPANWKVGLTIGAELYDGAVLRVELLVPRHWCQLSVRLFYSERMLRRSQDRWEAECLAGEHRGVTLSVSEAN